MYIVKQNISNHSFRIGEEVKIIEKIKSEDNEWVSLLCRNKKGETYWVSKEEIKWED